MPWVSRAPTAFARELDECRGRKIWARVWICYWGGWKETRMLVSVSYIQHSGHKLKQPWVAWLSVPYCKYCTPQRRMYILTTMEILMSLLNCCHCESKFLFTNYFLCLCNLMNQWRELRMSLPTLDNTTKPPAQTVSLSPAASALASSPWIGPSLPPLRLLELHNNHTQYTACTSPEDTKPLYSLHASGTCQETTKLQMLLQDHGNHEKKILGQKLGMHVS